MAFLPFNFVIAHTHSVKQNQYSWYVQRINELEFIYSTQHDIQNDLLTFCMNFGSATMDINEYCFMISSIPGKYCPNRYHDIIVILITKHNIMGSRGKHTVNIHMERNNWKIVQVLCLLVLIGVCMSTFYA